jgi:signal transduction histidine kinase
LATTHGELVHPDSLADHREHWQLLYNNQVATFSIRTSYRRCNGSVLWAHESVSCQRDKDGRVAYYIAFITDISAQVEAQHQLQNLTATLENHVARRTALVHKRSEQLRRLAIELITAEHRERRRIAHTLHDHFQQLLVAAKFRVDRAASRMSDETHKRDLRGINELIDETISASRTLAVELSPPVLFDRNFAEALAWLARRFQEQHRFAVEVRADPDAEPTNPKVKVFLFEAARELLFNAVKHAGVKRPKLLFLFHVTF